MSMLEMPIQIRSTSAAPNQDGRPKCPLCRHSLFENAARCINGWSSETAVRRQTKLSKSGQGRSRRSSPPRHGSSPAPNVCGGAQRGISLATGTFTGESTRNPLAVGFWEKRLIIKGLRNHGHGALDSFAESSLWKPPCRKPAAGSHLPRSR